MKLNKLIATLGFVAVSSLSMAQTLTVDCESTPSGQSASTTNNRNFYIANCWAFGAASFTNSGSQVIAGSYSIRSNSPTNLDPNSCWIKSPWLKPGSGNISFKMKFESNSSATNRRIILTYCAYDPNSLSSSKEAVHVRFDSITYTTPLPTTAQTLNFAVPAAIANSGQPYKIRISLVGIGGTTRFNVDDLVIPGTYWSDPSSNCLPLPTIQDADSDGVADANDAYPNDATRAYNNMYPAAGKGTLMFEDLWPTTGDYDFNDYVASYRYNVVTNASNKVVEIKFTLTTRAIGASLKNGFGLQFDNIAPAKVTAVTGTQTHNAAWVSTAANGTENGQTYANVIFFDDAFKILPSPGGSGVNVDPANPYATPVDLNVTVSFNTAPGEAIGINDLNLNPYLIVNQERGREVHLAGGLPTSKANTALFGTGQDATNPGIGKYYKTKNNLPWAIAVEAEIPYPKTKIDILEVYKNFASWAESSGASSADWYLDMPGYRDTNKLYDEP
ncbi:MAG: LruC domain-containing protein [Bacteroidetes bacterium]|nr:LruC domain-containing protein [Bacteroidota bacterium]